jgi:hypothetical protein
MENKLMKYNEIIIKWLILKPIENFSCGITNDKSYYYIFVLNEYSIYIEIFFNKNNIEPVLNIYKNKQNILSYSGDISLCLHEIEKIINKK